MNLEKALGLCFLVAIGFGASGCSNGQPRFKGVESYNAATHPNSYEPYVMDPGSYGGTAEASGGLRPGASYGTHPGDLYDGNFEHYARMDVVPGSDKPKDWGTGAADTSGIVVPTQAAEGHDEEAGADRTNNP